MSEKSWHEEAAELDKALSATKAQINGLSSSERKTRVEALRDGLLKEGVALSADDEAVINRFSNCECTFDELAKHFYGRFQ